MIGDPFEDRDKPPENETHTVTRCDGTVVSWTEDWQWESNLCYECGRPEEDGSGRWCNGAKPVDEHVGPIVAWMGPQELLKRMRLDVRYQGDPNGWRCETCNKCWEPLPVGYRNATIVDIRDVDLRDTTS